MFYSIGPGLEVTDNGHPCNLLRYGITYGRKKLYKIGSWGQSHKNFGVDLLMLFVS